MAYHCVWCGKIIDEMDGVATMDTCDECEDYFEEHIDDIIATLDKILVENEKEEADNKNDGAKKAWVSYSLISAIHMLSSKPKIEFKDSKFKKYFI